MDGACRTHDKLQMHTGFLSGNLKGKDHVEDNIKIDLKEIV
jgi:hypothetical protein